MTTLYRNLRVSTHVASSLIGVALAAWVMLKFGPYAWWGPIVGLVLGAAVGLLESRLIGESRVALSHVHTRAEMWACLEARGAGRLLHGGLLAGRALLVVAFAAMLVAMLRMNSHGAAPDAMARLDSLWWTLTLGWIGFAVAFSAAVIPALRGVAVAGADSAGADAT